MGTINGIAEQARLDYEDDALLKESEAASFLRCAPKTLANQRSRGEGPAYVKFRSGAIRYRLGDLRAELRSRTVTPGPAA
ncbi:MAG: helix-turn-helix transcriptional regulator [Pseudonocardiaceae bacterium]